jgi:hypothetical protein
LPLITVVKDSEGGDRLGLRYYPIEEVVDLVAYIDDDRQIPCAAPGMYAEFSEIDEDALKQAEQALDTLDDQSVPGLEDVDGAGA